jgi:hypothetical protein
VDADDRRDVDDRARTLLHHRPGYGATGVEDGREVCLDHNTPVVVGHAGEQAVTRQAGIVDEDVDIARFRDEARSVVRVRDVGLHRARAELGRERFGLLLAGAIPHDDGGAGRSELDCDCAADPARSPGDERRLSFQCCELH